MIIGMKRGPIGSTPSVTLDTYREVVQDENKAAFLIEASRYAPDGSLMQTFEAIFTVEKRDGDWRLISGILLT